MTFKEKIKTLRSKYDLICFLIGHKGDQFVSQGHVCERCQCHSNYTPEEYDFLFGIWPRFKIAIDKFCCSVIFLLARLISKALTKNNKKGEEDLPF